MKNSKTKFVVIYSIIFALGVVVDQLTKVWFEGLLANKSISVIGNWLTFNWTINHGAAFGMLNGGNVVFFICTLVGLPLFVILWWRSRTRHWFGQVGFCFVVSGTVGNAIDRAVFADGFFNGGVRDFISVKGFAIFNFADSLLVVGVIMACIALLFLDYDAVFAKEEKEEENDSDR